MGTTSWKALQEGLILPISEVYKFYQQESLVNSHLPFVDEAQQMANDSEQMTVTYKFLHDRVQQAAYSLIPDEQKASIHLKMGQLLLCSISDVEQSNKLFDIVNHLNRGLKLVVQPAEREKIAQLNGLAAKKARSATAYESAITYATTGITLLTPDCWQSQYELALMLHELAAENAFLSRDFEQMEHWSRIVLQQAKTLLDRVKIYEIQIQNHTLQHQILEASNLAKQVLSQLGIELPDCPTQEDIQQGFQHTVNLLAGRAIGELLNLPPMTAPEPLAAMKIATSAAPAIYITNPSLYPLLILSQVNASILYGNAPFSAFFYVSYGLLLNGILEDVEGADRAGKLGLALIEKLNAKEVECRTRVILGAMVLHGTTHLRTSVQVLQESYQIGLDTGDLEFAGYGALHSCQYAYFSSQELLKLDRDINAYSQMPKNLKQVQTFNYFQILRQAVLNLLDNNKNPQLLVGDLCDEAQFLSQLLAANDLMGLHFFYLHKLILGYLFGDTVQSLSDIAIQGRQYLAAGAGFVTVPIFYFYDSLAALTGDCSEDSDCADRLQRVAENQTKLQKQSRYAPMNYLHKWHLVEAEKHRVLGEKAEAMDQYDRAIAVAKEHGYIQEEALANELAAKFYLDWGKKRIAQEYITNAYYAYARWGAKAKVAGLEKRYPQLLAPILQQTRSTLSTNETIFALGSVTSTSSLSSSSSASVTLDLAAILKASQTISSEIELEKLLSSLLLLVIENAGADKCVLMLLQDNRLFIKGSITLGTKPVVLQELPIEESQDIPLKLIYTVKHNRQTVVLIDAIADSTLANDPYIIRQQPKSILGSPILYQGKLIGILYLENNLATGAFTSDRVELLNLLCAQAAISLENARLYQNSQKYAQQLAQSLAKLQASEIRFQNLANNIPGMVYQFRLGADGSTSTPYVSSGCFDLYELEPELVMTGVHSLSAVHHPDDDLTVIQAMTDSAQNLTPFEQEWRIIVPSGTVKWVRSAARPARQADGAIVWDGVVIDISDRKRAELALQQKSEELEQALHNLQNAQLQIIQSEKMSALGNLVAGVAHEMNNPLGFISATLLETKPTIAELIEHLQLYQETFPNQSEEIKEHAEEIDLEYTLEDLPKSMDSMSAACGRLKNISTSLRTFSRADRDYKVPFNIHEGIDSTLLILKHRLKANDHRPAIEVITNYGNLPQIECFPGQLNQVFMNILANAIDALEESNQGRSFQEIQAHPNRITIRTAMKDNEWVTLKITDNGNGIIEEIKPHIFDHLFTTKAVGKGTGLGLAIAKLIVVEKHGGAIHVNSQLSVGTEFVITLPTQAEKTR